MYTHCQAVLAFSLCPSGGSLRSQMKFPHHRTQCLDYKFVWCSGRKYLQRCKQPKSCNKFRLLIFLNQLYMFRATNSPILRSNFWLYIELLVPNTDIATDWWPCHQSAEISVHCNKTCICSKKVLLRMGKFVARNM